MTIIELFVVMGMLVGAIVGVVVSLHSGRSIMTSVGFGIGGLIAGWLIGCLLGYLMTWLPIGPPKKAKPADNSHKRLFRVLIALVIIFFVILPLLFGILTR